MPTKQSGTRPLRLISTGELTIIIFKPGTAPPYAILSHRWQDEEITLQEWQAKSFRREGDEKIVGNKKLDAPYKAGYTKIVEACSRARQDGHEYLWVDTCCIDKENKSELSEAINSMYAWYRNAEVCYAYLCDVGGKAKVMAGAGHKPGDASESADSQFRKSEWFERGWTLQELVAPQDVQFFSKDWVPLGTLDDLAELVAEVTSISLPVLQKKVEVDQCSVAQRISWAARRKTTKEEDQTYALLGILGIHMSIDYGPGGYAVFRKLQEEVLRKNADDLSILAWSTMDPDRNLELLAASPADFEHCSDVELHNSPTVRPHHSLTNRGLRGEFGTSPPSVDDDEIRLLLLECYHSPSPQDILALRLRRDFCCGSESSLIYLVAPADQADQIDEPRLTSVGFLQYAQAILQSCTLSFKAAVGCRSSRPQAIRRVETLQSQSSVHPSDEVSQAPESSNRDPSQGHVDAIPHRRSTVIDSEGWYGAIVSEPNTTFLADGVPSPSWRQKNVKPGRDNIVLDDGPRCLVEDPSSFLSSRDTMTREPSRQQPEHGMASIVPDRSRPLTMLGGSPASTSKSQAPPQILWQPHIASSSRQRISDDSRSKLSGQLIPSVTALMLSYQKACQVGWQYDQERSLYYVLEPRTETRVYQSGPILQGNPSIVAQTPHLRKSQHSEMSHVLPTPIGEAPDPCSCALRHDTYAGTGSRPTIEAISSANVQELPGDRLIGNAATSFESMMAAIQPFTDPRVRVQTGHNPKTGIEVVTAIGPKRMITDPGLFGFGVRARRALYPTAGDQEKRFPKFKRRSADFFSVGRVFQVCWSDPGSDATTINSVTYHDHGDTNSAGFDYLTFSKARKFVIVREGRGYCSALPITSYGGQGVAKPGIVKAHHGVVYTGQTPPLSQPAEQPERGERGMRTHAVRICLDSPTDRLDPMSRVDYAKVHTVHHGLKAARCGSVHRGSLAALLTEFQCVWVQAAEISPFSTPIGEARVLVRSRM